MELINDCELGVFDRPDWMQQGVLAHILDNIAESENHLPVDERRKVYYRCIVEKQKATNAIGIFALISDFIHRGLNRQTPHARLAREDEFIKLCSMERGDFIIMLDDAENLRTEDLISFTQVARSQPEQKRAATFSVVLIAMDTVHGKLSTSEEIKSRFKTINMQRLDSAMGQTKRRGNNRLHPPPHPPRPNRSRQ